MQGAEQTSEFHFTAFKNFTLAFKDDTASGYPMLENNPKCSTIRHYNQQNVHNLGRNP
jgi:hypothetical protein